MKWALRARSLTVSGSSTPARCWNAPPPRISSIVRSIHGRRSSSPIPGTEPPSILPRPKEQTMSDLFDNPMQLMGFEFVEFAAPDPTVLHQVFTMMGFSKVATHRSKAVSLYRQGGINFILNAEPGSAAGYFASEHGPSACGMAFRVRDSHLAYARALSLGAQPLDMPTGPMELRLPAIKGIGGAPLYLIDRFEEGKSIYDIDFTFIDGVERQPRGVGLKEIDHLTHNVYRGRMSYWAGFYQRLFNFREIRYFDIKGEYTGLTSRAMSAPDGLIRIPLNEESAKGSGQIEEFLMQFNGEGIQHIALLTDNLIDTWDRLQQAGTPFMTAPPATYYAMLERRLPAHGEPTEQLKTRGILLDGATGEGGQRLLLQIFSKPQLGPVFFEFIQRKGDEGFGEGNFKALFESIERDQIERGVLQTSQAGCAGSQRTTPRHRRMAGRCSWSSRSSGLGLAVLCLGRRQRGHVDDATHGARRGQHMHRCGRAQQDGADGGALAAAGLQDVEEDVGGIQVGADQHVGRTGQAAVGQADAVADLLGQGCVTVQFTGGLDLRCQLLEVLVGLRHLAGRRTRRAAVVGVRQEGHLGRHAEARHFLGRRQGDAGQLLGVRGVVDVGVGDEEGLLGQQHGIQCREFLGAVLLADHFFHMGQVAVVVAVQAAQHGVGVTGLDHQRGQQAAAGAHVGFAATLVVGGVAGHAGIGGRIDDLHVLARLDAQAGLLDAGFDGLGTTHQDGCGQAFVGHELHRAQYALVFTVGVDHALWRALGGVEDGLHEHAGLVDEAGQLGAIGVEVGDGAGRHAGLGSGLGHGRGDLEDQARIERGRDQVVRTEHQFLAGIGGADFGAGLGLGQVGDLAHAGQLHGFGDLGGAAVQRATEDVGEAQHIVDLVRIVRTAGGDDAIRTHSLGQFGADFRFRIGQGQDDGLVGHGLDHLGAQHARSGAAQEDVGAIDHVGQGACLGLDGVALLGGVQATGAAFIDDALAVDHVDVLALHTQADHHFHAGNRGRAGAGDGDLDCSDVLAHQFQAVQQGGRRDDGGTVLVIVEDRDVHARRQLLLDVEAFRSLDVFQVDAAQGRLQCGDDLDQLVGVVLGQFDVEHVDTGEFLEQAALAFHHRLGGQRTDVAQAQHGGAVADDGHQVAARGVVEGLQRIGFDVQAGIGHARRVGQRQVALVRQRLGGTDFDLATRRRAVVFAGGVTKKLLCGTDLLGHGLDEEQRRNRDEIRWFGDPVTGMAREYNLGPFPLSRQVLFPASNAVDQSTQRSWPLRIRSRARER
eukprot:TRINITY_DN501_c0_g7_i1.p1 TRINITY_DN501_c0_g7~~TRINITY_DN501_c0_g7_i1.p1  ORF type:complete len:1271 (+),score=484.06 TRINITY_DN501_c0_g7_i1:9557-13369(+)